MTHLYGCFSCNCPACIKAREAAERVGDAPLRTALAAVEAARSHYRHSTREHRALVRAAGPINAVLIHRERPPGARPPRRLYTLTREHVLMPNGAALKPEQMSRSQLIEFCEWNDDDGCFNDAACTAEFGEPASDEDLRDIVRAWMRDQ